jgi:hypothetical protein
MVRSITRFSAVAALALAAASALADAPASVDVSKANPGDAKVAADAPKTNPAAPATKPAATKGATADQLLGDMLKTPAPATGRPLTAPDAPPATDATSGKGAVKPGAPAVIVLREGTYLVDRVGRLTKSSDGATAEFSFESDGSAMQDPPVVIIPNLKLMAMEDAAQTVNRDLRFRITGMVTEYRGRNFVLLEKVVVVPDATQQFRGTQ